MANATQQRSGNATQQRSAAKRTQNAGRTDASAPSSDSGPGKIEKAKLPLVAGGAAAAGLAAGTLVGSKLLGRRRARVLGVPMPRGSEVKKGAEWVDRLQSDIRAVRTQAEQSRKQSPIEVVLTALTSRRLPRHGE